VTGKSRVDLLNRCRRPMVWMVIPERTKGDEQIDNSPFYVLEPFSY
jgi:hypothetical protein